MKLTLEQDRETVRRYRHVKAARFWRQRCGLRLTGTSRTCTREAHHTGPHVSHGRFGKVLAVWDEDSAARGSNAITKRAARVPAVHRHGGVVEALKAFGRRVLERPGHFVEEFVLLVFVLAMVGFVLDWALRILGVR